MLCPQKLQLCKFVHRSINSHKTSMRLHKVNLYFVHSINSNGRVKSTLEPAANFASWDALNEMKIVLDIFCDFQADCISVADRKMCPYQGNFYGLYILISCWIIALACPLQFHFILFRVESQNAQKSHVEFDTTLTGMFHIPKPSDIIAIGSTMK